MYYMHTVNMHINALRLFDVGIAGNVRTLVNDKDFVFFGCSLVSEDGTLKADA